MHLCRLKIHVTHNLPFDSYEYTLHGHYPSTETGIVCTMLNVMAYHTRQATKFYILTETLIADASLSAKTVARNRPIPNSLYYS